MKTFKNQAELEKYAEKRDRQLEVKDFNHSWGLEVVHSDGSYYLFHNYKLEKYRFKLKGFNGKSFWMIMCAVYSEHHKVQIFSQLDLESPPRRRSRQIMKSDIWNEADIKKVREHILKESKKKTKPVKKLIT